MQNCTIRVPCFDLSWQLGGGFTVGEVIFPAVQIKATNSIRPMQYILDLILLCLTYLRPLLQGRGQPDQTQFKTWVGFVNINLTLILHITIIARSIRIPLLN